jgi:hypothetical protein
MTKLEYNGYTNYETWLANLQYSDMFYDIVKDAVECLDEEDESFTEDFDLKEFVETIASTFEDLVWDVSGVNALPDGLTKEFATQGLGQVDWEDIAETHLSDFEVLKPFWKA